MDTLIRAQLERNRESPAHSVMTDPFLRQFIGEFSHTTRRPILVIIPRFLDPAIVLAIDDRSDPKRITFNTVFPPRRPVDLIEEVDAEEVDAEEVDAEEVDAEEVDAEEVDAEEVTAYEAMHTDGYIRRTADKLLVVQVHSDGSDDEYDEYYEENTRPLDASVSIVDIESIIASYYSDSRTPVDAKLANHRSIHSILENSTVVEKPVDWYNARPESGEPSVFTSCWSWNYSITVRFPRWPNNTDVFIESALNLDQRGTCVYDSENRIVYAIGMNNDGTHLAKLDIDRYRDYFNAEAAESEEPTSSGWSTLPISLPDESTPLSAILSEDGDTLFILFSTGSGITGPITKHLGRVNLPGRRLTTFQLPDECDPSLALLTRI